MSRTRTEGASGAAVALVIASCLALGCGGDDGPREVRDESRGGPYDACEIEADECPRSVDGCAGIVVEYADYRTRERGVCTSLCDSDVDCVEDPGGLGGACIAFGGGDGLCYERCVEDEDCPPDFGCIDRLPTASGGESFFEPICLPVR